MRLGCSLIARILSDSDEGLCCGSARPINFPVRHTPFDEQLDNFPLLARQLRRVCNGARYPHHCIGIETERAHKRLKLEKQYRNDAENDLAAAEASNRAIRHGLAVALRGVAIALEQ